ncbi:MAG: SDR family NAD(P)-dependent oxidoreductase [Deltaproteobacteria bacterium]|nr:SDR family NAD(P)-dependent oxidoreductase [Deltaproteobacteria bacterium]
MTTFSNAFITGASSGIGRAIARDFAAKGTRVIAAARREPELQSLVEEIRAAGGRADICVLDVADTDAVIAAIHQWEETTGGLDLVIANAGLGKIRAAHKSTWKDDIEPVLRVNILGAFATLMAGMEVMIPRGKGTLVGISSLASMRGLPKSGAYSASKAALATFLETLRLDLGRKGLTVVDVRPGFVDTAMTSQNKTYMPMLMKVDDAVRAVVRGIERGDAIVTCPRTLAAFMSMTESMPDALYRAIASRVRF